MDSSEEIKKIIIPIPQPSIKALVFNGGGIKGLAYAGALRVLDKQNLLKNIEWVVGTSAGAMFALMVALNYTPEEIEAEIKTVNFEEFKDHEGGNSLLGKIINPIKSLKTLLWDKEGYYLGKKLHQWVQKIVKQKLQTEHATFDDLHQKKAKQSVNYCFKDLLVTVTDFDKKIINTLGYGKKSTGRMRIADAVLASMSIPGVYRTRYIDPETQKMIWQPTAEQKKNKTLVRYVDGGVLSNYSIEVFTHPQYWPMGYYGLANNKSINPGVLGLRLDSMDTEAEAIRSFWASPNKTPAASPLITDYVKELFYNLISDNTKARFHSMQTIFIPISKTIGVTDFNINKKTKNDLINSGEKATKQYIDNYLKDAVYDFIVYKNHEELSEDYAIKKRLWNDLCKLNNPNKNEAEYRNSLEIYFQSVVRAKELVESSQTFTC